MHDNLMDSLDDILKNENVQSGFKTPSAQNNFMANRDFGEVILFHDEKNFKSMIVNSDGSDLQEVATGHPVGWSADGRWAYVSSFKDRADKRLGQSLFKINILTGEQIVLNTVPYDSLFSFDFFNDVFLENTIDAKTHKFFHYLVDGQQSVFLRDNIGSYAVSLCNNNKDLLLYSLVFDENSKPVKGSYQVYSFETKKTKPVMKTKKVDSLLVGSKVSSNLYAVKNHALYKKGALYDMKLFPLPSSVPKDSISQLHSTMNEGVFLAYGPSLYIIDSNKKILTPIGMSATAHSLASDDNRFVFSTVVAKNKSDLYVSDLKGAIKPITSKGSSPFWQPARKKEFRSKEFTKKKVKKPMHEDVNPYTYREEYSKESSSFNDKLRRFYNNNSHLSDIDIYDEQRLHDARRSARNDKRWGINRGRY